MTDNITPIVRQLGDAKFQHSANAPVILSEREPMCRWQDVVLFLVACGGTVLVAMTVMVLT